MFALPFCLEMLCSAANPLFEVFWYLALVYKYSYMALLPSHTNRSYLVNTSAVFDATTSLTLHQYLLMSHSFIAKAICSGRLPKCLSSSVHACIIQVNVQTMLLHLWFSIRCSWLVDLCSSFYDCHSCFSPFPRYHLLLNLYYSYSILYGIFFFSVFSFLLVALYLSLFTFWLMFITLYFVLSIL